MKQYLLSGLLTAVTSLVLSAQSGDCGENATWTLSGSTLTISGQGKMQNYYDPQDRKAPWKEYADQIHEIVVNPGITDIGDYAFNECTNATTVSLPEGLLTIGQHAFTKCSSLQSVTFPESLTAIGAECSRYDPYEGYVFAECTQLKTVTIPANVTIIARHTFRDCDIRTVYWNAENCTKGNYEGQDHYYTLFYGNQFFDRIEFGPTVKRIPCLLKGYTMFNNIKTSGSIELVAQDAFLGTQWQLEQGCGPVYVDKCLYKYIESRSIDYFTLEVREGTVGITACALYKNPFITRLTVPESLRYWDRYAIGECPNLKEVEWNAINCEMLNNSTPGLAVHSPMSPFITELEKITFGPKVERLYEGFLKKCNNIKHLELPASLKQIDREAFYGMDSLEELTIPDKVEKIGEQAFYECLSLTTLTIGKGVKDFLTYRSINGCDKLTTLNWNAIDATVPKNAMGEYVSSVKTVNFGDDVKRIPALGIKCANTVNIGKNVKELSEGAFEGWTFDHIDLPDGLKSIKPTALQGLDNLTELFIPASVDTLWSNAFNYCNNLTKVIIPVSRPAEKFIRASSGNHPEFTVYVPDVKAYKRIFPEQVLRPMVETSPTSFVYDGNSHDISITNVMPGYEAEMPANVSVSGADAESGDHTVWVTARFNGPRPFETEVGVTYTVEKAQDKLEWTIDGLPELHPGDRIDITGFAKTNSGTQPEYYVSNRDAYGYPASYYATVTLDEDGHWYLNCLQPRAMRLGCYTSWEDFRPYDKNWIMDSNYLSLDFEIVKASGLDSIESDNDLDVEIYSLAGVLLHAGPMAEAMLEPGIYIVKDGDNTRKIVVR